jgi:hypothetical protein
MVLSCILETDRASIARRDHLTVKLIEYAGDESGLEESENPLLPWCWRTRRESKHAGIQRAENFGIQIRPGAS